MPIRESRPEEGNRFVKPELRKAGFSDEKFLLELRNDPISIQWSVSGRGVLEFDHSQWFAEVMKSHDVILLIGEIQLPAFDDPQPFGMVRFDALADQSYRVSIAVAAPFRGAGFAKPLLGGAISHLEHHEGHNKLTLEAEIHHENKPSLKLFRSLDFEDCGRIGEFITLVRD